jgi:hypothetical protein
MKGHVCLITFIHKSRQFIKHWGDMESKARNTYNMCIPMMMMMMMRKEWGFGIRDSCHLIWQFFLYMICLQHWVWWFIMFLNNTLRTTQSFKFQTLGFFMLCKLLQKWTWLHSKKEIYAFNDHLRECCVLWNANPLQPSTRLQVVFLWRFQHGACQQVLLHAINFL